MTFYETLRHQCGLHTKPHSRCRIKLFRKLWSEMTLTNKYYSNLKKEGK